MKERKAYKFFGLGHFDVAGPDPRALESFYSSVFGWRVTPLCDEYSSVETPAGSPDAAIIKSAEGSLTIGVIVPDVAQAVEQVEKHGGAVCTPASDNGWVKKSSSKRPGRECH